MKRISGLIPFLLLLFLLFYPGFSDKRKDLFKKIESFFTGSSSSVMLDEEEVNKKSLLSDELDKNFNSTITNQKEVVEEKILSSKSTGAPAESDISNTEKQVWTQVWELRDASPIYENFFNLSFNEKTRLFDVRLLNNYGQEEFNNWLQSHNYGMISDDQFVFVMN